jgi:ATP-binding cassette, subfamily B, bacterial
MTTRRSSSSGSSSPSEASLPRIGGGRRRGILLRLVANGLLQAAAAVGIAALLHAVLSGERAPTGELVALAAAGVALAGLRIHAAGLGERLGQDYVTRVRMRIFEGLATRPSRAPAVDRTGLAMTRVISDLSSLRNWVAAGLARSAVAGVTLAAVLCALAWLRPHAALLLAAVVAVCGVAAAVLAPLLRGYVREARRRRGRLAGNLGEKMMATRTVQKLGRTEEELRRLRRHSEWLRDALVRRARASEALRVLPELAMPLAVALWLAFARGGDAREAAAGLLMFSVLGGALRDLARALDYRLAFAEGRRRITQLLDAPRLREQRRPRVLPPGGPLGVELDGVSVEGALCEVSLAAKPGERVLVSGPPGSGKSTLLALASRLLDPDRGCVRVDGLDLRELSLDSLHDAVQLVSPELPLLRGTIGENVGYGAEDDDSEWIEQVAVACGLVSEAAREGGVPDADVPEEGLATRVDERGVNLSSGLRARVALARALVMRPRLLLIDDPTFSVDPLAAETLRRGCALQPATTLVVAPESCRALAFDRGWRLEGGRAASD